MLEPDIMLNLYAQGAFPMADENKVISWYQPEIRTVIPVGKFNCPRSLKKFMKKSDFTYKFDVDTIKIIEMCAERDETWITEELIDAYAGLEQTGHLHSVGVYQNDLLVGGLYGVSYKGAFFGESMFSKVSQASKTALVKLMLRLSTQNFTLLDVQFQTEHLKMFGTIEIPFLEYSNLLVNAYQDKSIIF
ncbi:MAG: leucyl/phenylalanyl-tRNA--protein transferase [Melioribacteraceae bacterium]|nr:leucyl/phenylalanyl-tRNA--protein transferase [Melioribacteraceae bacterium]